MPQGRLARLALVLTFPFLVPGCQQQTSTTVSDRGSLPDPDSISPGVPEYSSYRYHYPPRPPVLNASSLKEFVGQYRHSVVVLQFWAGWSPQSRDDISRLAELNEEERASGLRVIACNLDPARDWSTRTVPILQAARANYPCVVIPPGARTQVREWLDRSWNLEVPARFILDRRGEVVARFTGNRSIDDVVARAKQVSKGRRSAIVRRSPARSSTYTARRSVSTEPRTPRARSYEYGDRVDAYEARSISRSRPSSVRSRSYTADTRGGYSADTRSYATDTRSYATDARSYDTRSYSTSTRSYTAARQETEFGREREPRVERPRTTLVRTERRYDAAPSTSLGRQRLQATLVDVRTGESKALPVAMGRSSEPGSLADQVADYVASRVDRTRNDRIAILPFPSSHDRRGAARTGQDIAREVHGRLRQRGYYDLVSPSATQRMISDAELSSMTIDYDPSIVRNKLDADYLLIGWLRDDYAGRTVIVSGGDAENPGADEVGYP